MVMNGHSQEKRAKWNKVEESRARNEKWFLRKKGLCVILKVKSEKGKL